MNLYHEILFWSAKLAIAGLTCTTLWGLGLVFYDRYVNGNVDAFKPERRVGPADRRAHLSGS
jgi:hypothetical protein